MLKKYFDMKIMTNQTNSQQSKTSFEVQVTINNNLKDLLYLRTRRT